MAAEIKVISITPAAGKKIREVVQGQNVPPGYCLRVGIRGQAMGCAGVSYLLGFDEARPGDMVETVDGIPVVIDPKHSMFVMGMEIDWHEDEEQQGFVFNNPLKRAEEAI